ncbi:TIGR03943 family protein [Treponema sp. HNW]|uniref:TIGR03943 family putative permease subunit n=1 Tax=Treponema sp. HNW TaxID=3116654 RepID=UPI003D0BD91E
MTKKERVQLYTEAAACAVFGFFLLKSVIAGGYLVYVTPRIKPWLIFTAAIMFLWSFSAFKSSKEAHYPLSAASVFVLLIPLVLMLLPLEKTGIDKVSFAGSPAFSSRSAPPALAETMNPFLNPPAENKAFPVQKKEIDEDSLLQKKPKPYTKLAGYDAENRSITVHNDDFLDWTDAVYKHPADFDGWHIEITGMIFYDSQFMKENEFIPARLLMVCCAADLVPYGLICRYDNAHNLEKGKWVTVSGTLSVGTYHGNPEPQILVESISPAERAEEYVYPRR